MLKYCEVETHTEMGAKAADIFAAAILEKPDLTLGLATGTSPIPLYGYLVGMYREGKLDFSAVTTINLDEYIGLPSWHCQSYRYFMDHMLFDQVNIDKSNTHLPDGMAADLKAECTRYDHLLESGGGIDLQLLGVGRNGHIGFNEPAALFSKQTAVVALAEKTIMSNARLFDHIDEVPKTAISMSIKHIMLARKIVLVAGGAKRDILEKAFHGDITPEVPASVLQMHPDVTVVLARD